MKKLLIVTDAWEPQINGVVSTLKNTIQNLSNNFICEVISPQRFNTFSLPFYKEIKLSLDVWNIKKQIENSNCTHIHIATEGTLGLATKLYCDKRKYNYTTSYHTNFAEYLHKYFKFPKNVTYNYLKWFHSKSANILVPTNTIKENLENKGFKNITVWSRGVDTNLFNPNRKSIHYKVPVVLYVGRISKEKGIEDFLNLKLPGFQKRIVGDGPELNNFKKKYKNKSFITFVGRKTGIELAKEYANAHVFVFPSITDTFGITLLESLASGVPVAAYEDQPGPKEVIKNGVNGFIGKNLEECIYDCYYKINRNKQKIVDSIKNYTWKECTKTFEDNLIRK